LNDEKIFLDLSIFRKQDQLICRSTGFMTNKLDSTNSTNKNIPLSLDQLCPTHGPVDGFVRPSFGLRCSKSIVHTDYTCLYFGNLEFDIFDAGGPECHFIMSFTSAVRIRTLLVHLRKLNLVC